MDGSTARLDPNLPNLITRQGTPAEGNAAFADPWGRRKLDGAARELTCAPHHRAVQALNGKGGLVSRERAPAFREASALFFCAGLRLTFDGIGLM